MNATFALGGLDGWKIAGWTMLHFLWMGAIVGALALITRWLTNRAPANMRYAAGLTWLIVLAALPLGIAGWLVKLSTSTVTTEFTNHTSSATLAPIVLPTDAPPPNSTAVASPIVELHQEKPAAIEQNGARVAELATQQPSANATGSMTVAATITVKSLVESCVPYLPWLWIFGTPITFALLAAGLVGTKRLKRASRIVDDPRFTELLARVSASLNLGRHVSLAVCERIASPVLVGILRPMVLLPPSALTGWTPDELEMVLLHELAHVRRWDNLVNVGQRIIESLLFFHPAVWLVSSWVRRERETCCDAFVVRRTERPHAYAELLVALAAQMPRSVLFHPAASSAMSAGPLRSRIRRILQLEDDPMLISGNSLAVVLGSLVVAGICALLYIPGTSSAEEKPAPAGPTATVGDTAALPKDTHIDTLSSGKTAPSTDEPSKQVIKRFPSNSSFDELMKSIDAMLADHKSQHLSIIVAFPPQVGGAEQRKIVKDIQSRYGKEKVAEVTQAWLTGDEIEVVLKTEKTREAADSDSTVAKADWPAGVVFPSPKESKISARAWKELGLKIVPASDDELEPVRRDNLEGGLKVLELEGRLNLQGPMILTHLVSKGFSTGLSSFEHLQDALNALQLQPPDELIVVNGIAKGGSHFTYSLKRPSKGDGNESQTVVAGTASNDKQKGRIVAELPPNALDSAVAPAEFIQAYKAAKQTKEYLKTETSDDNIRLFAVPLPAEKDWPAMLGDTPRKDRVIAEKAWEKLGLKVAPLPYSEVVYRHSMGYPLGVWIVGGNVPAGLPRPTVLTKVGGNPIEYMDALLAWLESDQAQSAVSVKCYATDGENEYLFDTQAPTADDPATIAADADIAAIEPPRKTSERQLAAYEVPPGLSSELKQLMDFLGVNGVRDERDRLIIQASPYQHERLKSIFEATPKWREKAAAEQRSRDLFVTSRGQDGQQFLQLPSLGLTFQLETRPEFKLSDGENTVQIAKVEPGSPADWQDIRPSDSLAAIDDFRISSFEELRSVYKTLLDGFPSKPKILRVVLLRWQENSSPQPVSLVKHLPLRPDDAIRNSGDSSTNDIANAFDLQLVFFHSPESEPSEKMKPLIDPAAKRWKIAKVVDIDVQNSPNVAKSMSVDAVPTVILMRGGKALTRLVGLQSAQQLDNAFKSALAANDSAKEPARYSDFPASPSSVNPNLRYDGKTFNEWRTAWKTELSTEKRLECVQALAAFGRSGYGKDAALAIIEIGGQYDWARSFGTRDLNQLRLACLDTFGGDGGIAGQLASEDAIPALLQAADSSDELVRSFVATALQYPARSNQSALNAVFKLTEDSSPRVRSAAWRTFSASYVPTKPEFFQHLSKALAGSDPIDALQAIVQYDLKEGGHGVSGVPDFYPLLFSPNEMIRRNARAALQHLSDADLAHVVALLIDVLKNESRQKHHVEAIQALAVIGPRAESAAPLLTSIAAKDDAGPQGILAALALSYMMSESDYNHMLVANLGKTLKLDWGPDGVLTGTNNPEYKKFEKNIENVSRSLLPP